VITNIIDNSIRYGNPAGGRTKITFFDMDENILTEISDDGSVLNPEISRVFLNGFTAPIAEEQHQKKEKGWVWLLSSTSLKRTIKQSTCAVPLEWEPPSVLH